MPSRQFLALSTAMFSLALAHGVRAQQPPPTAAPATPPPAAAPAPAPAAPAPLPPPAPVDVTPAPPGPNEGAEKPKAKSGGPFAIESEDGAHTLEFRALVHADARFYFPRRGPTTTDTFVLRRVRPSLDARLFRYFELKLQPDFAGSRLQILDAYANLHFVDEVELRVGKGKPPVGFERLRSPADIMFAERGFPTLVVPNRDVGFQLHGQLWKGALEYAGGIYNGVPDGQSGDQDENGEKDYEGRVFGRPFLAFGDGPLSGLGVGIAGVIGIQEGTLATYRTSGQQTFFTPASVALADGERTILAPQAAYYFGPAAVLVEYVHVKQRLSDGAAGFTQLDGDAWQVAGSFLLGGRQSYQGVKVDRPLDPEKSQWGAVELAARFHSLRFDPRVFRTGFADRSASARVARAWTLGATWHFAKRVRALVNYERTDFEGGAASGNRKPEDLVVSRMQVAF
jgi:phosphate-selective porin OprO and OprP